MRRWRASWILRHSDDGDSKDGIAPLLLEVDMYYYDVMIMIAMKCLRKGSSCATLSFVNRCCLRCPITFKTIPRVSGISPVYHTLTLRCNNSAYEPA